MIQNVSEIASDPKLDADPPPYGVKLVRRNTIETFQRRGWRIAPLGKARMLKLIRAEAADTGRDIGIFVAVVISTAPSHAVPRACAAAVEALIALESSCFAR